MSSKILVTSAAGKVGTALVRELQEIGAPVRAAVRKIEQAVDLKGPNTEIVEFDFDKPELIANAVKGISTLALITPPHYKQVEWATELIDRALEAGVERIVRLSVRIADMNPSTTMSRWHRTIERYLKATDAEWTIVRPTPFFQNFMGMAPRSSQGYFFPVSEDTYTSHMDLRDAALVLAKVLTEPGHSGKIYTITGTESQTFKEMCDVLTSQTGREFPCHYVSDEEAREVMLAAGMPSWLAEVVLELFSVISRGFTAEPLNGFEELAGRTQMSLERFAEDHANVLPNFSEAGKSLIRQ